MDSKIDRMTELELRTESRVLTRKLESGRGTMQDAERLTHIRMAIRTIERVRSGSL